MALKWRIKIFYRKVRQVAHKEIAMQFLFAPLCQENIEISPWKN
jgi:hypothetical protein